MLSNKKEKILIADDDESIRMTLDFILSDQDLYVETATNGMEAIRKVKEKYFNMAILDYNLPDVDGVTLGKNIKEISESTEIVILTGKATLESAMKSVKENFHDYLTKPVDPDKLIEVINSALEKQRLIFENKMLVWELKKTNKKLEKLNKIKDGLIAMISHDLRSPISSLKGFNYSLLEGYAGELSEKQKEIIRTENEAIDTMMVLINNLLDMRQVEEGELRLRKEVADIRKTVIEPVVKRLSPQLNGKSIKVEIDCEEDLPLINMDISRIDQVIQNILQNAIKFTYNSGTIKIGLSKLTDRLVKIQISDSGKGLEKEDLNAIFEIFYTKDEETPRKRDNSGRGLGLAICKEIIKLHGGSIWAESEGIGKGSTFTIMLPFK